MKEDNFFKDYENLMQLVYQYDFYDGQPFEIGAKIPAETLATYDDIISRINEINQHIEANLFNYSLSSLNGVDRAIIQIAVYYFLTNYYPAAIVMDVAIDITKKFSQLDDEKQHKFTNKLLDNILKSMKA